MGRAALGLIAHNRLEKGKQSPHDPIYLGFLKMPDIVFL
jgi:hypothetical protein